MQYGETYTAAICSIKDIRLQFSTFHTKQIPSVVILHSIPLFSFYLINTIGFHSRAAVFQKTWVVMESKRDQTTTSQQVSHYPLHLCIA